MAGRLAAKPIRNDRRLELVRKLDRATGAYAELIDLCLDRGVDTQRMRLLHRELAEVTELVRTARWL